MKKLDIARAWTDEDYYLSLSAEERASLPANPAAAITISDDSLRAVNGGIKTSIITTCGGTAICSPCPPLNCY
jgi:mersacidin/lichenicidin family type 2 lantibiotic